ncbi:MAG: hypothetical protein H7Z14_12030 [Anaerolineae bacterium]|nr:hypothetical protein [Phycisphaerae bacterium]
MRFAATIVISFALMLSLSSPAFAQAALSEHQQKMLDEVKAGLDTVEQGLADAQAKLDAGDVTGASNAYNTATRNYNNHVRRIGQLPTNNASVTEQRDRAQALGTKLKETGAALKSANAGRPAAKPAPNESEKKPAPPAGARLDYRQEEKLKNIRFYLSEIDPRAARLFELTSGKLDAEAIAEAREQMAFVQQRMGYTIKALNDLPADNPDVAAASKQYNELLERLGGAQAAIDKAAPEADKQMAALGQQMNDDLSMVDSWSKSLGDPQSLFHNRPDDAIAAVGQLPQMREALASMQQRWAARATEKSNDQTAAEMVLKLKYVDGQVTELERYTKNLATELPQQIDTDLSKIQKLIDTAVTEKRPAYFGPDGGIAQQMKHIEQRTKMLRAIDPSAADKTDQSLAAAREKSAAAQKSLAQDIINANKKPAERYSGADKEDLRARVIAKWKDAHPDKEIVAVIFNTENWERTTRWDWSKISKTFSKVDYDRIQPKLFCKLDDTRAVMVPVEIEKDYMKGGQISVMPWEFVKDPPVTDIYLLENLK